MIYLLIGTLIIALIVSWAVFSLDDDDLFFRSLISIAVSLALLAVSGIWLSQISKPSYTINETSYSEVEVKSIDGIDFMQTSDGNYIPVAVDAKIVLTDEVEKPTLFRVDYVRSSSFSNGWNKVMFFNENKTFEKTVSYELRIPNNQL